MDLYIVRHGKTQWNIDRRLQGITDTPLHADGFEDARVMGAFLAKQGIKQIYSSPLQRTYDTAQTINDKINVPLLSDGRLVERDFKMYSGYAIEDYVKLSDEEKANIEPVDEVVARGLSFYHDLLENENEPTLVVTHGGLLGLVLQHLQLLESGAKIKHRCVYHLTIQQGKLSLEIFDLNRIQPNGFTMKPISPDHDFPTVLKIYQTQPTYFEKASQRLPTITDVCEDYEACPPHIDRKNKHYHLVCYYDEPVAVVDFIDDYPENDTVYIGFLIHNRDTVLSITGSDVVRWLIDQFIRQGFVQIKLGVIEENPEAYRFWKRLGFIDESEKSVEMNGINHRVFILVYPLNG